MTYNPNNTQVYIGEKRHKAIVAIAKNEGKGRVDILCRAVDGFLAQREANAAFYGANGSLLTPEYCRAKALEADVQANDLDLLAERHGKGVADACRVQAANLRQASMGWTWLAGKVSQ